MVVLLFVLGFGADLLACFGELVCILFEFLFMLVVWGLLWLLKCWLVAGSGFVFVIMQVKGVNNLFSVALG